MTSRFYLYRWATVRRRIDALTWASRVPVIARQLRELRGRG